MGGQSILHKTHHICRWFLDLADKETHVTHTQDAKQARNVLDLRYSEHLYVTRITHNADIKDYYAHYYMIL